MLVTTVLVASIGFAGVVWQWLKAEAALTSAETNQHFLNVALAYGEWSNGDLSRAELLLEASRRGRARTGLGELDTAAADYARALKLRANDVDTLYGHALLCLEAGNSAPYRSACAQILETSAPSKSPNDLAFMCSVAPNALADPTRAVQLAQSAVAATKTVNSHYLNTLGATLYRAGEWAGARQRVEQAIEAQGMGGTPYDWLFLAMTSYRMGQVDEARQWLDKAAQAEKARKEDSAAAARPWYERLELQLLRQEAEAMLNGTSP